MFLLIIFIIECSVRLSEAQPASFMWDTSVSPLTLSISLCGVFFFLSFFSSFFFFFSSQRFYCCPITDKEIGRGMTGVVLDRGRKPSLAAGFQKTEIQPQIWLMSFPVCNCARINASVLDPRENQSFVKTYHFPTLRTLLSRKSTIAWIQSWMAIPTSNCKMPEFLVEYLDYIYIYYISHITYEKCHKKWVTW